ncbi:MAG: thioredoxin family protein [Prolixibacteraceae bacterium]|jgi:thioredoxin|nr:thioredoxin family protein [Prolixibacteraceae bacterium]
MDQKTVILNQDLFKRSIMDYTQKKEWEYAGDKPAIIYFFAEWCSTCKAIAQIIEDLAQAYQEEICIYKVDIEEEKELSVLFRIQSVPSLLFIPMESKPQMLQGALPKDVLEDYIESILLYQEPEEQ